MGVKRRFLVVGALALGLAVPAAHGVSDSRAERSLRTWQLRNAEGRKLPVGLPKQPKVSPFAQWVAIDDEKIVYVCNAFAGYRSAHRGWIFTAMHCPRKATELGATRFFIIFFSAFSGQQKIQEITSQNLNILQLRLPDRKGRYEADLVAISLPLDTSDEIAYARVFDTKRAVPAQPTKYTIWGYEADRNSLKIAEFGENNAEFPKSQMKVVDCPGYEKGFPEVKATWQHATASRSKEATRYLRAFSDVELIEQNIGLYLEQCRPSPGQSGALVVDSDGVPMGLFQAIIDRAALDRTWDKFWKPQFETDLGENLGDGRLGFRLVSPLGRNQETKDILYGQAISFTKLESLVKEFAPDFLETLRND